MQDKKGILWIGTNGGLNRYDGSVFMQYSILSQPALSNSIITVLREDEQGCIWIGTENGLNILNPATNTIRQFVNDDSVTSSFPFGPIRDIEKLKNGDTWIMGERWIAAVNNRKEFSPLTIDTSLSGVDRVFAGMTGQNDKEVWISYLDQGTVLASKQATSKSLARPTVYLDDYAKIFIDSNDITWSISNSGIGQYNRQLRRFDPFIKNKYAIDGRASNLHLHTCYSFDANGDLWQGNDRSGLVKYDIGNRQVTDFSWLIPAVNATIIYCIYKDNNNTLWIGTDNGIIKVANRDATFVNIPFVLHGNEIKNIRCRRIIQDQKGNFYAATENYGMLKKTVTGYGRDTTIPLSSYGARPVSDLPVDGNCVRIKMSAAYDIGYIYDMYYDGGDFLWLAGWGIGRMNLRNDSLELFLAEGDEIAKQKSINQFSICYDGRYFWTSGQQNMYLFDPVSKKMLPFRDKNGNMPFENLPCWSLYKRGDWIYAGAANGLYKIHILTKEVTRLDVHRVLEFGINDIAPDGDSSLWISSAGGGLIWFNEYTGQVKQFTNQDGLTNNTICGLLEDKNHDLWISTYGGLSFFNRQTQQFTNFYTKDGLNTDEFNRKAFNKLTDGRMIFGGLNGYMIFNPDNAFRTVQPVTIHLTRFSKINNKGNTEQSVFDVDQLNKIWIEPGDKFFTFNFMLSDLYDPSANRYFYQLQGVDNAWHSIGSQTFVSFNGLSAGTYTLKIKGNTGRGSVSTNEISIDIVVKQVFYTSFWFIALVVAAAAAIVWQIVRYRIRQIKKIQHLRTRIASDLHDDVGSSLVRITVLADAIKRGGMQENTQDQLGTIAGISRGAVSTMKDVVWSIDARNDTMGGMIEYMQEHLHNMLGPANIDFELTHTGFSEQEKLNMNFRQNVYLTFKEAINNVVKHSGATRVLVDLKKENGLFTMLIKDDGRGMAGNKNSVGHGLHNMKLRAGRLKANLDVISEKGVTITLKVPV